MKLVVNALLGVGMQAIAEALALGIQLGLPRDLLFDTLGKTAVVAPAHLGKLATAKQNDYKPQFPLRLMRKDFGLILSKATELGVPMPTTVAAAESNTAEAARGHEEDFEGRVVVEDRPVIFALADRGEQGEQKDQRGEERKKRLRGPGTDPAATPQGHAQSRRSAGLIPAPRSPRRRPGNGHAPSRCCGCPKPAASPPRDWRIGRDRPIPRRFRSSCGRRAHR